MKNLSKLPSILCFTGENYHATRSIDTKELVLRIEMDLGDLAEKHCELGVFFKVFRNPNKDSDHSEDCSKGNR